MHSLFKKGKAVVFHLTSLLLLAYMFISIEPSALQRMMQSFGENETSLEHPLKQEQEMLEQQQQQMQQVEAQEVMQKVVQEQVTTVEHRTVVVKSPKDVTVSSRMTTTPDSIQVVEPTEEQLKKLKSVEVVATGYTAGYESTGKTPDHPEYGITYSGIQVRRDHLSTIAADLDLFPLGTILWIPGYGYGIVSDIGGAIKGNKIDLYFETEEDVYRYWGKKTVNVYVIEEGSGELTEAMFGEKREAFAG